MLHNFASGGEKVWLGVKVEKCSNNSKLECKSDSQLNDLIRDLNVS